MGKKQITILIIVTALFFSGVAVWLSSLERTTIEPSIEPPEEERFGLTGWVLEVDIEDNFLVLKSEKDGIEIKAFLGENTELLKIERPTENLGDDYVVTIKTPIELADFQRGDYISLRTRENIVGKREFSEIIQIHFYPHFARLKEN